MDLHSIVRQLNEERARLDEVIRSLESLIALEGTFSKSLKTSRRGRKEMPEAERRIVSERMRKYWEKKRKQ